MAGPADAPPAESREHLARRILARAEAAGVRLSNSGLAEQLAAYLELLGRWNRRINLTALDVDPASDAAIDRLVIEPVAAMALVESDDQTLIDVGSGGGSPAIPMKLAAPWLELVMFEVRERKAAFLREAVRQLELDGASVEARLLADSAGLDELTGLADIVTLRGVRLDASLGAAIRALLTVNGRVLVFRSLDTQLGLHGTGLKLTGRTLGVGNSAVVDVLRPDSD